VWLAQHTTGQRSRRWQNHHGRPVYQGTNPTRGRVSPRPSHDSITTPIPPVDEVELERTYGHNNLKPITISTRLVVKPLEEQPLEQLPLKANVST
jgi:hypothetical protein